MIEWNVYRENINTKKIEVFNVFKHANFCFDLKNFFKDCKKESNRYNKENKLSGLISHEEANKYRKHMLAFEDQLLKNICKYNFCSKSEYEIIITSWPPYIDKKELLRLENEDETHIQKWAKPAYSYIVNLCTDEKIDIYDQLRLNWEVFKQYIFDHEKEIKKLK